MTGPGPAGPTGDDGVRDMRATEDELRTALHDDAYRYAFRRSLSAQLASAAALEAVEAVEAVEAQDPGGAGRPGAGGCSGRNGTRERITAFASARAALERYVPPALPPRVEGTPDLQGALASLSSGERELLLLHHWEGLGPEDAAAASRQDAGLLPVVEAACARLLSPGPASAAALAAALSAADPARAVSTEDLVRSRRNLPAPVEVDSRPPGFPTPVVAQEDAGPAPSPDDGRAAARSRRIQAVIGAFCLVAIVAALAVAVIPRTAPGPAEETARLFGLADVVAVVAQAGVEPTMVEDEIRILRRASVVQVVKGEVESDALVVDVTGRSTLERPYSRNFFPANQIMFLVRDADGSLSPMEGENSVLTLVDRRSPVATTIAGDPAPLPDGLRKAIRALPADELPLATSGEAPGALDPASIVGIRPPEGRDVQNLPGDLLGVFRASTTGGEACVWFEFADRSVLLRWPEGFSAYRREPSLPDADGGPSDRRVLTVLNERGYPYVDENRSAAFIRGVPTGTRGSCGGQELEVWDIAVAPGSTLLFY